MEYSIVKWLHILSSTILFGTGVGSAFHVFMANRSKDIQSIRFAMRVVVIADWLFTTPAIIFQLASGLYLVHLGGFDLEDNWIKWAITLYIFAGLCWLPVVWMQIKMRDMTVLAIKTGAALPQQYWRYDRWWMILGSLAFPTVVIIFWLMVIKPG